MRKLLIAALLVAMLLSDRAPIIVTVRASGTYTAASCSRADVDAVVNGPTHVAVDGDVINIPAGTCIWSSGIIIPLGIGIQIVGAGQTDAHNPIGSATTTIIDNYTASASWLFFFQPTCTMGGCSSLSRLSSMIISPAMGLAFNSLEAPVAFQGTCTANGAGSSCPNVRMDHVVFPTSPELTAAPVFSGFGTATVSWTAGTIYRDGATASINVGSMSSLDANQTSCSAPAFSSCDILYWPGSGTTLQKTQSYATASSGSNIPVVYLNTDAMGNTTVIQLSTEWYNKTQPSTTMVVTDSVFGPLDHNSLYAISGGVEFVNFNHSSWQGVGSYGDNSWASVDSFGTDQALFVETNYLESVNFTFAGTESEGGINGAAAQGGGRIVCRFNTSVGLQSFCANHGTESGGRVRGGRQMEFYKNLMDCPNSTYSACWNNGFLFGPGSRSGTLYSLANSYTGKGMGSFAGLATYRALQSIPSAAGPTWGACDGTRPYDNNAGSTLVYGPGIMTMVNGGWSFVDPGLSAFMPIGGVTYSVHDLTTGEGSQINNFNSGTNTLSGTPFSGIEFNNGDSYEILVSPTSCLDQAGRSRGSLLSGNFGSISPASMLTLQDLDPIYQAADTNDQGFPGFGGVSVIPAKQIANRDYYAESVTGYNTTEQTSNSSPFNGSSGTGYGTTGSGGPDFRPAMCTQGTGYWGTDVGSWNSSGGGGQGQLFICGASNNWVLSYTPYDYPHPLVGNYQSFSSQPTNTVTGVAFSSITVTVNPPAADSITLSDTSGTCTFTGTATQTSNAMTGVATFSLTANATGTSCVLTAHNNTDGTITDVMSSSFNITSNSGSRGHIRLRRY